MAPEERIRAEDVIKFINGIKVLKVLKYNFSEFEDKKSFMMQKIDFNAVKEILKFRIVEREMFSDDDE